MTSFAIPFSLADARLCMELSDWAYLPYADSDPLRGKLATRGLDLVATLTERAPGGSVFKSLKNDTEAFCAEDQERLYIVFRGSEPNLWDWLTDFRIDKEHVPLVDGVEIHEGFYSAISGPQTRRALQDWIRHAGQRPIILAGHSLGGALAATVAVLYPFIHRGLAFAACYTYGQPRIGLISSQPATPICRIVNKVDIVPRVPFDFGKALGDVLGPIEANAISHIAGFVGFNASIYAHVGSPYVIGQNGEIDPAGETAYVTALAAAMGASAGELVNLLRSGRKYAYQGNLITDHFRDAYETSLSGLAL